MPAVLKLVAIGSGGAFAATGLGKFTILPNPGNQLYAGYMLGTAYSDAPLADLSGNGRTLTLSAGSVGATYLDCGAGVYGVMPFTGDTLAAAGGDAATLVTVARADPAIAHIIAGNYTNGTTKAIATTAPVSFPAGAFTHDGAVSGNAQTNSAQFSDRGTAWYMFASVHGRTYSYSYIRKTGMAAAERLAAKADGPVGGAGNIRIGAGIAPATGWAGSTPDVAVSLAYRGALSKAQLDQVFDDLVTLQAGFGQAL